ESLVTALEAAAYRGVVVRVLVGGPPTRFWTVLAARSYYDTLLQAGVEVYEYRKGMLHSKTLSVDGQWCLVGSVNFDSRSLLLNFEAAVAMHDSRLTHQLDESFQKDVRDAIRVDPVAWSRRPRSHVLGEDFFRLFAPLL
ncbi:MAG: cardiolipin synthase, partial [Planctomycetes bacterium]|nr:cardiolipin synthase [Planctomycetota bacterium]